ncbi:MAG: Gfo/Idh/MocA family oxidoreductase, partial [Planctomycetes bacterium]|nr:Gfo/Idh/MocA family oxidoreductase [Planctomycetota bacterium]
VGLIGCGGRGTGAALQALRAEAGTVVLTAMADVFPERVESSLATLRHELGDTAGARLQVPPEQRFSGFDAYAKLLATDVHVVLLAAPPHFRPEHLRASVAAGKHVFTEKPMAVDAPGVRSVLETVEAARQKRLALVAGFCWRYRAGHRATYARIHEGAIGSIRAVYSTYNTSTLGRNPRQPGWSDMEYQLRNWQTHVWLAGDHVVEQAIHSLDKQAWTFGDVPPLSCTAVGGNAARDYAERGDSFDHFGVTFDYPDGAKAFHMCRQIDGCTNDNTDWVWGTQGDAHIEGWGPNYAITGAHPWEYDGPDNDMYQQEHDELFASIRRGEPINDGTWMARSTMLAIMARMAAYTGQTLTWEQALASTQRLGPETYAFGALPAATAVAVPGKTAFA